MNTFTSVVPTASWNWLFATGSGREVWANILMIIVRWQGAAVQGAAVQGAAVEGV
jgi:hypothetical protein